MSRKVLAGLAAALALLAILPLINLIAEGLQGLFNGLGSLGPDGGRQLRGTLSLLLGSAFIGTVIGTANGWLLINCRFPGRRWLRIAQLIPLATPAYLLSATLVDLGSRQGWRIHGLGWGIVVMALATYPYVFLLSTESFAMSGRRQLEACRSLGVGPWAAFRRVALPIAIPAIGAGVALMGMEIVNELGAVQLLGIPSLSAGILEAWQADGNPTGAISLALITLVIVLSLVIGERRLRRRSRRWSDGVAGGDATAWSLRGVRALTAQLLAVIPPLLSLGTPLFWVLTNLDQLQTNFTNDLLQLSLRSLLLALAGSRSCRRCCGVAGHCQTLEYCTLVAQPDVSGRDGLRDTGHGFSTCPSPHWRTLANRTSCTFAVGLQRPLFSRRQERPRCSFGTHQSQP
jgi:iron(III) transport system permease protein